MAVEKQPINGWLVIDKPADMSSNHVVTAVKKILHPKKIGHAGTLDPFATGVLPLALGEATKTVQFAMDKRKTYYFELTFGEKRDTGDTEGEVIAKSDHRPVESEIEAILAKFTGDILQTPPKYSALKVNGKRAYKLARAGEEVKLKPRKVTIDALEYLDAVSDDIASFRVTCSKGTYVRTLGENIAEALGTVGYVSALRREKVGFFNLNHTISLARLEKLAYNAEFTAHLHSVDSVLDDILAVEIEEDACVKLRQGQRIPLRDYADNLEGQLKVICHNALVAIGQVDRESIKPVRVFNL
jgi:tRNA pseudouridine55 synthase